MDLKRKIQHRNEENEDDLMILAENTEEFSKKRAHYLSYTERYFKKFYKLNVRSPNNDHMILMHSNRIAVCTLAPSHPILKLDEYKVTKIEFIQQVTDEMSGKHKHNAKNVNVDQPICKVYCNRLGELKENEMREVYFLLCSCLNAKLIEINEKLLAEPELLQTKPFTQGYIAILMPKLYNLNEQTSELMPHADYLVKMNQNGSS